MSDLLLPTTRSPRREAMWPISLLLVLGLVAVACTSAAPEDAAPEEVETLELEDPPRRYSADWLITTEVVNLDEPAFLYREVTDDLTGTYLVQSPNHLAVQTPEEVVLCAAINRVPLDPYCASSPRAEGSPHVLSYPVQLLSEWSPRELYDLASYREVSLAADSDTENWGRRAGLVSNDIGVECFLVTGTTTAAATGFEICFTDDDLHLVASVDLQSDLIYEIDLVRYERDDITDDFTTDLEDFFEERPSLQEQLLDLYPEIPAPRPTPTPAPLTDE